MNKNTILHKLLAQVWQGLGNNVRARIKRQRTIRLVYAPFKVCRRRPTSSFVIALPSKRPLLAAIGLLPAMNDRLIHGSVILMDDAIPQAATIQHWKEGFRGSIELVA